MKLKNQYFGNATFCKKVLLLAVPIIVQNGITNFVGLLDNVMIGSLGTEAMSGVSIVNEFIFIFNMVIFGASAAAGIFTAQYHGAGDTDGVRSSFRMKLLMNIAISSVAIALLLLFGDRAISMFLHSSDAQGDLLLTLAYGREYLGVMLLSLIPYALTQTYSSTLRETGEANPPMYAGIIAVAVNFTLNSLLIFGLFGLPALGVRGAAIATVISRICELAFLLFVSHRRGSRIAFARGSYRSLRIPRSLVAQTAVKGLPLMANELLWSVAMTLKNQCISTAGLEAVAAMNIQNTLYNVMNISYMSLGNAIAIILGAMLGAGRIEEAKAEDKRLLTFSVLVGVGMCVLQFIFSPVFPLLYNTSDSVRSLAGYMLAVSALSMPANALAVSCYYTLRSGGLALLTMLFDCVYAWVITLPVAYLLATFTSVSIHLLFAAVIFAEAMKCVLGLILVCKVRWARRLT